MKQMLFSFLALIFSTSLAVADGGQGSQIEGVFEASAGRTLLRTANGRFNLQVASAEILRDLKRLQPGDYISGRGEYGAGTIHLETLDTVGLRKLFGIWRARTGEIVEFNNFFVMSFRSAVVKASSHPGDRVMHYTLAPEDTARNRWSIFMADDLGVVIGTLEVGPYQLWLKLYDPNSGRTISALELFPVR